MVRTSRFMLIFTVYKYKNMVHELIQESWKCPSFPLLWNRGDFHLHWHPPLGSTWHLSAPNSQELALPFSKMSADTPDRRSQHVFWQPSGILSKLLVFSGSSAEKALAFRSSLQFLRASHLRSTCQLYLKTGIWICLWALWNWLVSWVQIRSRTSSPLLFYLRKASGLVAQIPRDPRK